MVFDANSKVGILGAGSLGLALASRFAAAELGALICARPGHDRVVALPGSSVRLASLDEVTTAEIVVLALPEAEVPDALACVTDWEGRILIDASSPGIGNGAEPTRSAARSELPRKLAGIAPGAQVVRAFSTLPSAILAMPPEASGGRRVLFYSGDPPRARAQIGRLIRALGFAGIDLGSFAEGGPLQRVPDGVLGRRHFVEFPL